MPTTPMIFPDMFPYADFWGNDINHPKMIELSSKFPMKKFELFDAKLSAYGRGFLMVRVRPKDSVEYAEIISALLCHDFIPPPVSNMGRRIDAREYREIKITEFHNGAEVVDYGSEDVLKIEITCNTGLTREMPEHIKDKFRDSYGGPHG